MKANVAAPTRTLKVNMLARTFRPHRLLSAEAFEQFATDWVTFGMGYLERRNSMLGSAMQLRPTLAKYISCASDSFHFFPLATSSFTLRTVGCKC